MVRAMLSSVVIKKTIWVINHL